MLELRNIDKTYTPKHGKPVHALKNISLKFDTTGMVFILGKSGCGKSTLLNVIGGLDTFDKGEIIIKGKSSLEFSSSDFDSYRNTFVGFIFQEYNILSEFNIAKNIALAIELQGKKATPEKVQELLEMVDLATQGNRKTNELSGGQKQRVAIARALIKEPEIIIADEPTGALDSVTGAQVFDTLKKLSKDKLVIIVSHDREYAEIYADRIIEMKDGNIISDETKRLMAPVKITDHIEQIGNHVLRIAPNYSLTSQDVQKILEVLNHTKSEKIISYGDQSNEQFKKMNKISNEGHSETFTETRPEDFEQKTYDKKNLKFIKSKLRLRDSFKMGASSLKTKPIRLIVTILLSLVSFTMFGLADTFASYNKVNTTAQSFLDSNYKTLAISGEKRFSSYYYLENGEKEVYYYYNSAAMTQEQIDQFAEENGLTAKPIYPSEHRLNSILANPEAVVIGDMTGSYFSGAINGYVEFDEEELENFNCNLLAGRLPTQQNEIAISKYTFELFAACGIIQKGYEETLSQLKNYLFKYEDLNGDHKKDKEEFMKIDVTEEPYQHYQKEEFLNSGTYFVTCYKDLSVAEKEDFIALNTDNLNWANDTTLGSLDQITVSFVQEKIMSEKDVENYQDVLNLSITFDEYYQTPKKYFTIVGVVNTNFDDKGFEKLKENAFNPIINPMDQEEYLKIRKFSEMLKNGLHEVFFVSPGYIQQNSSKFSELYKLDEEMLFYLLSYYPDELTLQETPIPIYFNYTTMYRPSAVLLKDADANLEELKDNQYVVDFRLALNGIQNCFEKEAYQDPTIYESSEYEIFQEYCNKLNDSSTLKDTLKDSHFRDWLLANQEKWNIYVGQYVLQTDQEVILEDTSKEIVGLYLYEEEDEIEMYGSPYVLVGSTNFYRNHQVGCFSKAITTMPQSYNELKEFVQKYYNEQDDLHLEFRYSLNNSVMSSLEFVNSFIETTAKVFLYIGIGFAFFAGLMLANFISISISYKKREIGILRAIGARKKDVFSIFFDESFIIATINFVLSAVGTILTCSLINRALRVDAGIEITILICGVRQIILIALLSLAVAFLASAIPVYNIAKKQPIDAINNR